MLGVEWLTSQASRMLRNPRCHYEQVRDLALGKVGDDSTHTGSSNAGHFQSNPAPQILIMTCSEDARLKQLYYDALFAWRLNRRLLDGIYPIESTLQFRKDLLAARHKASRDLYDHSVTCPKCKTGRFTAPTLD
jgi:hypothetical protein